MIPTEVNIHKVHYRDLTNESMGVFTFSHCWGEHWAKSMTELRQDLVQEFGNDFILVDIEGLTDDDYKNLEVIYASL